MFRLLGRYLVPTLRVGTHGPTLRVADQVVRRVGLPVPRDGE
jgi:hypothetical protein